MIVTFGEQPPVFAKPKSGINTPYPPEGKLWQFYNLLLNLVCLIAFMPKPGVFGGPPYIGQPPYPSISSGYSGNYPYPIPNPNNPFQAFPSSYPNSPFPNLPPGGSFNLPAPSGGTIKVGPYSELIKKFGLLTYHVF